MNETQKNWREAWKDYEPTEHDQIYRNIKKPGKKQFPWKGIVTAVLVVAFYFGGGYVAEKCDEKFFGISYSDVESNRNGVLMAENIKKIQLMFDQVSEQIENGEDSEVDSYIIEINEMDLSYHYDEVKEKSIEKLKIAQEIDNIYKEAENTESEKTYEKLKKQFDTRMDQYEEIDITEHIVEAFEQAGVEYTRTSDGEIGYTYYEE